MDFKDKLVRDYGFNERDRNETIGRYWPETLKSGMGLGSVVLKWDRLL
ncbi:MAG: hypothetical protein IH592_12730 [Bacteroidales bacterium]|nr:hypothetical protein [Bacteroidales bacterium]